MQFTGMDKKRKEGYVAGIGCFFGFAILLTLAVNNEWNTSGQLFWAFTVIFGGLGVGCIWKPETVGAAVSKYFERFSESEKGSSDSHNKQVQKKSSGVQVMAQDQSNVTIYRSERKEDAENQPEEEFLCKETRAINPLRSYSYEFDFTEGEHLKGEVTSTSPVNISLMSLSSYSRWKEGQSFIRDGYYDDVLETAFNYLIPQDGTWYLVIENKDEFRVAKVKVRLF